jgi:hypothetical protein
VSRRREIIITLLGFVLGIAVIALLPILLLQKQHHRDVRQALKANDVTWEVCRAAMGAPAEHAAGGGWIRASGLTSEQLSKAASSYDNWVWTDKAGRFTKWPGREDDTANDDEDSCSEAWRAGYSVATEND